MKLLALLRSSSAASRRWQLALGVWAGAAASCETPATQSAPAGRPHPATATAQPGRKVISASQAPLEPAPPTPAQLGYHRYVGTIGGRPVLAEFTLKLETIPYVDSVPRPELDCFFYYRASGRGSGLGSPTLFRPDQALTTYYPHPNSTTHGLVVLRTDQPLGPLLTGWCRPPGQQQAVPMRLRESYADGVRYELLHEELRKRPRQHFSGRVEADSGLMEQTYVHLLGPDTLRPALARLQCPPPATRRRTRQARMARFGWLDFYREFATITLNEAGPLAYTLDVSQGMYGTRYDEESERERLYDLHTGQLLTIPGQLRPGGLRQLQRLFTHQALADTTYAHHRDYWLRGGLLPLPAGGFTVTPTGLVAGYREPEYEEDLHGYGQTISWATLRPLLRPASPLHRLLRARELE